MWADDFADPFDPRFPSVIANPGLTGSLSAEGGKQSNSLRLPSVIRLSRMKTGLTFYKKFVEMESSSDVDNAMKALNDSELNGRNIVVNEAKARN